jgi:hypothetical protein
MILKSPNRQKSLKTEVGRTWGLCYENCLWTYIDMDLYGYGPIFLWTYIDMDLYGYGPILLWTYIDMDLYGYGPILLWTYIDMDLY